jgi:hypothetical protein
MFHYKLKTHDSGPLDKSILELRCNTANDLRDQAIYVDPRKNLDLNDICDMYTRLSTTPLDKMTLQKILKRHGCGDDVLPGNIIRRSCYHETRYRIKVGLCLWNYVL